MSSPALGEHRRSVGEQHEVGLASQRGLVEVGSVERDRALRRERVQERAVALVEFAFAVEAEHDRAERLVARDQRQHRTGAVAACVGEHGIAVGSFLRAVQVDR